MHNVDHLIFDGDLLRHASPLEKQNELLSGEYCIVGASGQFRLSAEGEVW
jgi:hypothetical protein